MDLTGKEQVKKLHIQKIETGYKAIDLDGEGFYIQEAPQKDELFDYYDVWIDNGESGMFYLCNIRGRNVYDSDDKTLNLLHLIYAIAGRCAREVEFLSNLPDKIFELANIYFDNVNLSGDESSFKKLILKQYKDRQTQEFSELVSLKDREDMLDTTKKEIEIIEKTFQAQEEKAESKEAVEKKREEQDKEFEGLFKESEVE